MRSNGTAMKARKSAAEDPLALLGEDLSAVRRDLGAAVRHGGEVVSQRATSMMHDAGTNARTWADRAKSQAVEAHRCVGAFAAERPVTTIALAALSGAVLAGLVSRGSRS